MIEMDDDVKRALETGHVEGPVRRDHWSNPTYSMFDLLVVGIYRTATGQATRVGLEYLIKFGEDNGAR